MRLWTFLTLCSSVVVLACSNASPNGDLGPQGPAGPQGPPGPQGPAGSRAVLRNSQGAVVGHFMSSTEIFFPSIGCSMTLTEFDRTGEQVLQGTLTAIFFSNADCTGDAFTPLPFYSTACLMTPRVNPIGTVASASSEKPLPQEAVTARGARIFKLRSPALRAIQTWNSRLEDGVCNFLDPTSGRMFRLDEVQAPTPSDPLSIGVE